MLTAETILGLAQRKLIKVSEHTKIADVLKLIIDNKCGEACVVRGADIVGFWSERDLMRNMLTPGFSIETSVIGDYMVTELYTVPHTATLEQMEDRCVGLFIRHLFVEKEGRIIGMVTSWDMMIANLNIKSDEVKNLKSYVSFEYYENWRWKKK
jgi:CBS domain-containing protein